MSQTLAKYNVVLELIAKQKGDTDKIKKEVGGLQNMFKLAGAAFAGIMSAQAVSKLNQRLFQVTSKYQKYNTVLKVALGSNRKAAAAMKLIEETASGTIFSVDELTASYIKFVNRGVNPTKEEIIALADLAASQGKTFDQLTEAVLDAQTGEFERLKEFGIKARSEGDKVTLSFKGVNKTIDKTPEAISKTIIELGKMEGVMGANIEQMVDLEGLVSNIGDTSEKVFKNLGEKYFNRIYKNALKRVKRIVELFERWTEIPLEEKLEKERVELNLLATELLDANISQERRNELIKTLQTEYPDFLGNLDAEKLKNEEIRDRLKEINEQYIIKIFLAKREEDEKKKQEKLDKQVEKLGDRILTARKKILEIGDIADRPFLEWAKGDVGKAIEMINMYMKDKTLNEGLPPVFFHKSYSLVHGFGELIDQSQEKVGDLKAEIKSFENETQEGAKALAATLGLDDLSFLDRDDGNKGKGIEKGKGKGSESDAEKKKRIAAHKEFIEHFYAIEEKAIRESTENIEELGEQLEHLSLLKQKAILEMMLQYTDENTSAFVQIENQLNQLERDFDKLIPDQPTIEFDLIPSLGNIPLIDKSGSKKGVKQAKKFLEDLVNEMLKGVEAVEPEDEDDESVLQKLFGFTDDEERDFIANLNVTRDAILDFYDAQIQKIDELINKQQERVDRAEEMADKGKVAQLKIEEERLNELEEKREKHVKQQQVVATLQIATAQSVAAAKAIEGLVSSFSSSGGGPAGIASGVAYSLALGAAMLSIYNAIGTTFSNIPGFFEGTELVEEAMGKYKYKNGRDGYVARFDGGERIVDSSTNTKMSGFPNKLLPEAIQSYHLLPHITKTIHEQSGNRAEYKEMRREFSAMRQSFEAVQFKVTVDKEGLAIQMQKMVDEAIRRKKFMA